MIKYKGIDWHSYQGALLPKTPPHEDIYLTKEEQIELLKLSRAYFLRYNSHWDCEEKSEFWYIIKDEEENLEQYSSNNRTQIRKGLKNCIVKKVTAQEIAENGYSAYIEAFKNYKTDLQPSSKKQFYNNHIDCKNDFFAVYEKDENKMIAYSQNIIQDNMVNYSTIKFHPDYLKLYPSYALFYIMNQYYINEKKYLYVSDGARSISHDTNIQDFLIQKFHFRKAYCRLNIVYRDDVGLLVNALYPFKTFFAMFDNKYFKKILVLLKHEEIRKSYD